MVPREPILCKLGDVCLETVNIDYQLHILKVLDRPTSRQQLTRQSC